ncbi:MAG TPA: RpiB/LacA/LacB family sugar-phosphate isomerase [Rhodospirillales bacterium]|nr:RpiB/LacA/LacB family sugar-phosphate isomerase [Rhodospirillales bacterium]
MPVAIACDHGGIDLKAALTQVLQELGCQVLDLGTNSTDSVDYPDFGYAMGRVTDCL